MGIAWGRGRDLTLYNDYDWEHLRQKLVGISALALGDLDESGDTKKIDKIQKAFVGIQKIQVKNPESTLYSKPGFEWHWTRIGFQLLKIGKQKEDTYRLTPSCEAIFSILRELDINEVYIPINKNYLTVIINPDNHNFMKCTLSD
jgi:hypothetical protein